MRFSTDFVRPGRHLTTGGEPSRTISIVEEETQVPECLDVPYHRTREH
jgi:hypothetical protein